MDSRSQWTTVSDLVSARLPTGATGLGLTTASPGALFEDLFECCPLKVPGPPPRGKRRTTCTGHVNGSRSEFSLADSAPSFRKLRTAGRGGINHSISLRTSPDLSALDKGWPAPVTPARRGSNGVVTGRDSRSADSAIASSTTRTGRPACVLRSEPSPSAWWIGKTVADCALHSKSAPSGPRTPKVPPRRDLDRPVAALPAPDASATASPGHAPTPGTARATTRRRPASPAPASPEPAPSRTPLGPVPPRGVQISPGWASRPARPES